MEDNLEKAFAKTLASGMKLASENLFKDPTADPLALAAALRSLGLEALVWQPETLFAAIDRTFNFWTNDQVQDALDKFHDTGLIHSDVPSLVRQKIYAIRVVATSDTAHNEWHIFEKVGCVFNNRVAQFGVVERLSPLECARTVSIIEHIRPDGDGYSREIKTYIAASCHEEGLLTIKPSKYLSMANQQLTTMNYAAVGTHMKTEVEIEIRKKIELLRVTGDKMPDDDIITIQALKLLAVDAAGDQAGE